MWNFLVERGLDLHDHRLKGTLQVLNKLLHVDATLAVAINHGRGSREGSVRELAVYKQPGNAEPVGLPLADALFLEDILKLLQADVLLLAQLLAYRTQHLEPERLGRIVVRLYTLSGGCEGDPCVSGCLLGSL